MSIVQAYDILLEGDRDILNEGTTEHIKNYFLKKELEDIERENNKDVLGNIARSEINVKYIEQVEQKDYFSVLSINKISTVLKIILFVILLVIVCDYYYI